MRDRKRPIPRSLVNAFQSSFNRGNLDPLGGNTDGFLTKLNATGTGLIFSTFLGGNDEDTITGIALDSVGRVHVTGMTSSTNFPTLNAAQPVNAGTINDPDFPGPDAFVTKFETNGVSASSAGLAQVGLQSDCSLFFSYGGERKPRGFDTVLCCSSASWRAGLKP